MLTALALCLSAVPWIAWHADYYTLPHEARPFEPSHATLKPSGALGIVFGVLAAICLITNLAYLARRQARIPLRIGSLRAWMTSHIVTGLLALLMAVLHSAMDPQETVGGHALLGLAVLVMTGAIGRYFYAFVPRAANGREMAAVAS